MPAHDPPVLRLASPDEVDAVRALVAAAYGPWIPVIGMRPGPLDADYDQLIAAGRVTVSVQHSGGPIAGLIVLVPEPGVLLVENVAVDPRVQGRGIGRALLAHAETTAREAGLGSLRLYTHRLMSTNIALYERLGYAITASDDPDGDPLVHLTKVL